MIFYELIDGLLLLPFCINGILCTLENLFSIIITSVMVWISSISVARISVWVMVASVSISISVGVWMVSGISVPGIWISLSFCFCFSLLDNMNCTNTVSVVCVWFYVVVGIWMVSVCVWMVSSIGVWSYYYGFCRRFLSCLLFSLLISGFDYCWNVVV